MISKPSVTSVMEMSSPSNSAAMSWTTTGAILDDLEVGDVVLLCPTLHTVMRAPGMDKVLLEKRLAVARPDGAERRSKGIRFRHEVVLQELDELRATGAKYLVANRLACRGSTRGILEELLGPPVRADESSLLYLVQSR